jgi:predicted DNA-binding transcriptional regulator YafY
MLVPTLRRSQLCRLLQIVNTLQSGRRPNARQLAEECEVSRRTIFRDLDAIEAAGIPIEYDPTRQGYRIASGVGSGPLGLDEREVRALALLIAEHREDDAFGLLAPARSGIAKLLCGLPNDTRRRVEAVVAAFDDRPAAPPRDPSPAHYETLLEAIARRVQVRITVRRDEAGAEESIQLSPFRIFRVRRAWYLVGRAGPEQCIRRLALADLEDVRPTDEPVVIPPRFRLGAWLERSGADSEGSSTLSGSIRGTD